MVFLRHCFTILSDSHLQECDICSYNASDWSSVVVFNFYLAVDSFTKQNITTED